MRVSRSSSTALATTLVAWLAPLVTCISVPTGKVGPITPARATPPPVNPHAPAQPAPVVEYSQLHPEPPPLHPSYVPPTFNYFDTLSRHHIVYVPTRFRNFNAISNEISYEPPLKYQPGITLGKNVVYKRYKQPYFPAQWNNQRYNAQYSQQVSFNNVDSNQYNNIDSNQYIVQPTQQQPRQQQEVASTAAAPSSTTAPTQQPSAASTAAPDATPATHKEYRKVDYSTGKGSYDVTGKAGSKSDFYSQDWSKKTSYPKKVPSQSLTHRKYYGTKY